MGPDADETDDVAGGCHARGMFAARGNGVGSDFRRKSLAETVRDPGWALMAQVWGVMVDKSNAEGVVKKGVAGRAIVPGRC